MPLRLCGATAVAGSPQLFLEGVEAARARCRCRTPPTLRNIGFSVIPWPDYVFIGSPLSWHALTVFVERQWQSNNKRQKLPN